MKQIFNLENRFFLKVSSLVDLLFLNIVFLISCLLIVTIIPSVVALNRTMLTRANGNETYPIKLFCEFWLTEVKSSLKMSLILFPLYLISIIGVGASFSNMGFSSAQKIVSVILFNFIFIFGDTVMVTASNYDSSLFVLLKNSLIIMLSSFRLIIFGVIQMIILLYFISPFGILLGIYFFLFGGIVFLIFIKMKVYKSIFQKIESKQVN